jgi:putative peptide zinc metalloprotease protein
VELPALREELSVRDGPRQHDGQPTWTLHDPTRDRFFRLDWLTFEILQRWSLADPRVIARSVSQQTPLRVTVDDVSAVLTFAGANQLLRFSGADVSASLAQTHARTRVNGWQWLLHNYLFFRIPLFRPDRLLGWLDARLSVLFSTAFWYATTAAGAIGFGLLWRQWDTVASSVGRMATTQGLIGVLLVLVGVKILHELGHGLVAKHFGCRVPTMGVAFLVMTPLAYTDTNEAWNLAERRPRLLIGAGGMLAEIALAAWSTLAWSILPDGALRDAALLVATTTWVKSVLINASPIMRFDGYYLLSDYLDVPNLHARSFALARWKVREWLFALGEPPPEQYRRGFAAGLIALAIFIWLYRLVLFVGIAVFVYHYFFKALGIVLFAVEIAWFIIMPIASETKIWFEKRRKIRPSPQGKFLIGLLAGVAVAVCIPFPHQVRITGQTLPQQELKLHAPEAGCLAEYPFNDGELVKAGTTLLRIDSELLQHRLQKARAREASLEATHVSAANNPGMRARMAVVAGELATARAARSEAEIAVQHLAPVAPFDGVVRLADIDHRKGEYVSRDEHILTLVGSGAGFVVAYLPEADAHLITEDAGATFHPEGTGEVLSLSVVSIERDASRYLAHPLLSSPAGGDVNARWMNQQWVPDTAVYRVIFRVRNTALPGPKLMRRGGVVVSARAESLAARWTRNALTLLWRELGF